MRNPAGAPVTVFFSSIVLLAAVLVTARSSMASAAAVQRVPPLNATLAMRGS